MGRPKGIPLTPEHKAKLMAAAKLSRLGKTMPAIYKRECVICKITMLAKAPNKKWCSSCVPTPAWIHRAGRYGISKPVWDQMLSDQDEHCALCPVSDNLVVDHNHETNVVRGLLCYGCNIALNRSEVPGWSARVSSYLGVST